MRSSIFQKPPAMRSSSIVAFVLAAAVSGSTAPLRAQPATCTIPVILSQTGIAAAPGRDQMAALGASEKLVNRTGGKMAGCSTRSRR
jgi:hypothetical protein